MEASEFFKTDNTSLATYLSLTFEPVKYQWEERACFWYFKNSPELAQQVTEYSGGEARVEPRAYSAMFSNRKKELFQAQRDNRAAKNQQKAS